MFVRCGRKRCNFCNPAVQSVRKSTLICKSSSQCHYFWYKACSSILQSDGLLSTSVPPSHQDFCELTSAQVFTKTMVSFENTFHTRRHTTSTCHFFIVTTLPFLNAYFPKAELNVVDIDSIRYKGYINIWYISMYVIIGFCVHLFLHLVYGSTLFTVLYF